MPKMKGLLRRLRISLVCLVSVYMTLARNTTLATVCRPEVDKPKPARVPAVLKISHAFFNTLC